MKESQNMKMTHIENAEKVNDFFFIYMSLTCNKRLDNRIIRNVNDQMELKKILISWTLRIKRLWL